VLAPWWNQPRAGRPPKAMVCSRKDGLDPERSL
jgi:hypothetical protein